MEHQSIGVKNKDQKRLKTSVKLLENQNISGFSLDKKVKKLSSKIFFGKILTMGKVDILI